MNAQPDSRLLEAISATAAIYGRDFTPGAALVLASDLSDYPTDAVLSSLSRCRRELRTFPTVADIIARIDDGRPGIEEAWAMLPQSEDESLVWTEEMSDAFGRVRHLIESDPVAGRMAFKEIYGKLLSEARAERKPVRWWPSLGHDKQRRADALRTAVARGQITQDYVQKLVPELAAPANNTPRLTGPKNDSTRPITEVIEEIRQRIKSKGLEDHGGTP